jgi:hypothetical protein
MIFFEQWFRKFGIRRVGQLMIPPLIDIKHLELPRSSVYHYLGSGPLEAGPAGDEFIFRTITRPMFVKHVVEISETKGHPRRVAQQIDQAVRQYQIKNRRYKGTKVLTPGLRDPQAPLIINYAFLHRLYRYVRSMYVEYNRWSNIMATFWDNAAEIATETDRNQFIMVNLPKTLPGLSVLRLAEVQVNQVVAKVFNGPESMMLLELWKWCGENRQNSHIAKIPKEHLRYINIVFQESGRFFSINLAVLDSFRAPSKLELEADPELPTKGIAPAQFQRRMLRMMMTLFQVRTDAGADLFELDADGHPLVNKVDEEEQEITHMSTDSPTVDPETGTTVNKPTSTSVPDIVTPSSNDVYQTQFDADGMTDDQIDEIIDKDLKELDRLSQAQINAKERDDDVEVLANEEITLESGVMRVCERLAEDGLISANELLRYQALSKKHKEIIAPDGVTMLDQFIKIDPNIIAIKEPGFIGDIATVPDKSMLHSTLLKFDSDYIKHVMHRDVAGMVLNIQKAGICVTGYKTERIEDAINSYDMHTVNITPVEGASSTFHFKLPALEEDGTYLANGIKYRMRKQRGELPIRKVAPNRVSLTSYYGKVFVNRSEKRVNDYGTWLCNAIMARGLDNEDKTVTDLRPNNVFDNLFVAPRLYSTLAHSFSGFTLAGYEWSFDRKEREALYGKDAIKQYEKDGVIILGRNAVGTLLVVDKTSALYEASDGNLKEFPSMEALLDLPIEKAPVEFAEMRVMGKTIPLGVVLGYEIGLEKLIRLLNVEPRRVPAGTRLNLESHEYPIVFQDETLVFSRDDRLASLFLAGFGEYHRAIRNYSVYEFDRRSVYMNILEGIGRADRYLREIDLLYQLFIDPITREILIDMKEPTDFRGLLFRSAELLLTDYHPAATDPAYQRLKGNERMAGAVYSEVVRAIRAHSGRAGKSRHQIDIKPFAVWKNISQDPSISLVNDINPIENLKQAEAVTTGGTGGRNSRSMTKVTREYNRNDMGTISESNVDSADVGINTQLSANPLFTSLRGISKRYDIETSGAASLLSVSGLISPASDMDDPKRVNFIGIQHSHGIACDGYRQAALRTGYEQVIAHRTGELFATTAKKNGKVIAVSANGIVIEYEDGEKKGIPLGRQYGNASGMVIPHFLTSDLRLGQEVKSGDIISFNKGFFERDILNPNQVIWKAGITVKTVLLESTQTLEDSSAITKRVAKKLQSDITKVRTVVLDFDQAVHKIAKAGTPLNSEDILCTIEDAVTANSNQFDQASLDTLSVLGAQTPLAKVRGVLERVEIFYHGDKEDMSETLRAAANESDRESAKRSRAAGKKVFTGSVDEGFRVDGDPLGLDKIAIRFYITSQVTAGVGDKGVFGNQLKTVFGEVMDEPIITEDGEEVDAIFGAKSVDDRIVLSPHVIGTTTTLLRLIGYNAYELYLK